MTQAVLGLGGNIGDTRALMSAAISKLSANPKIRVEAVSALYETPPWGKTDQPPFKNAAVLVDTALRPRELLRTILDVEQELGRRRAEKWGPRTLDIDILLFGSGIVDEPGLRIPHPHLHERAFALRPLIDVLPEASVAGRSAVEWLAELDQIGLQQFAPVGWHLERA